VFAINESGVGEAGSVAITGPVITGLVKVNTSMVAARARGALRASETASADSERVISMVFSSVTCKVRTPRTGIGCTKQFAGF
jgi:hypothetical protein